MSKRSYSDAVSGGVQKKKKVVYPQLSPSYRPKARYAAEPELKFFDTDISFNMDATPEIPATGQLSLIPQGDTQSTRGGRKCVVTKIDMHGIASFAPGAGATAAGIGYMYLVQDTQCNGAAATVADANTGIFTNTAFTQTMRTLANVSRFKILKKWEFVMNSQAGVTTAYNNVVKSWNFHKKCYIPLEYDGAATTGALTTIRSNNIFLVAASNGGIDDLISIAGVCRLRFMDS